MRSSMEAAESRREFFRSAGRYFLLVLLAGAAAATGRNKPGGQRCINPGICRGCGAFAGCGLPQALAVKRAKGGGLI